MNSKIEETSSLCWQETIEVTRRLGLLLRRYRTGHAQWYAELLVASALRGIIQPTNNPQFDLLTAEFGRVEVKSRVDGTDTTQNRVNLGRYDAECFDHAAIVIFHRDYRIKAGIVLPCETALSLIRPHGHVKWIDAAGHADAIDVTARLREISAETDDGAREVP